MSKTVVGLFSSISEAEQVKQALVTSGYDSQQIHVMADDHEAEGTTGDRGTADRETGIGHRISSFFSNLTGGDEAAHHHYASGVNSGGGLLAVTCADEQASQVATLLKQHGARDIEGASASTSFEGGETTRPEYAGSTTNVSGETAIPIVEEQLEVGKREVERGGVRVYSHVVERPVTADVTLRDEQINIERRAVNRPATAADFAAGNAGVLEVNATGEEAVIGKTARVVEEVLVGKTSTERTEEVHDSVRRTEVEVEQLPGTNTQNDY